MEALLFPRNEARYVAAMAASRIKPGAGASFGPLRLTELDPPDLPGPGWEHVTTRLAGICGSDLATIDGRASRYFEALASFPFVPGHEVVAERADGTRVDSQVDVPSAAIEGHLEGECAKGRFWIRRAAFHLFTRGMLTLDGGKVCGRG